MPRGEARRSRPTAWRRPGPERTGHRREHDPRRPRRTKRERQRQVLQDLGMYRCAALGDIVRECFGGHPYAARASLNELKRKGLVGEYRARGPKGGAFRVLYLSPRGRRIAEGQRGPDLDPGQRYWHGRVKAREAAHEAGVYRAGKAEARRIVGAGGHVLRIRTDSELKAEVARAMERERARNGRRAAEAAKRAAARALGLPVREGRVLYPDLQIGYRDRKGALKRANIEVATANYRARGIASKAAAGFRLHAADGRAARLIALHEGSGRGAGAGRRDEGLLEL